MKFLLTILLFISLNGFGQITYFGSASTPSDNGTNTATTTSVTPPGSMTTGDLVVIVAYQRGSATISVSDAGGQSWNTYVTGTSGTATLAYGLFWCRYNGSWPTNPSIAFSAGTNTNVVMHVFRPSNTSKVWAVDDNTTQDEFFDQSGSATFTQQGLTIHNASSVALATAITDDDNTWTQGGGGGYSLAGSTQYRNTSGNDVSSNYAYKVYTSTGSTSTISHTQATLGTDPGVKNHLIFYESDPPAGPTRRVTIIQ